MRAQSKEHKRQQARRAEKQDGIITNRFGEWRYELSTRTRGLLQYPKSEEVYMYDLYLKYGVGGEKVTSIMYYGTIRQCYKMYKMMLRDAQERYPERWETDIHFIASIHERFDKGNRNGVWLLHEHAPLHDRYTKRATQKFRINLQKASK